jgi:secreted trypsin-like serine protease
LFEVLTFVTVKQIPSFSRMKKLHVSFLLLFITITAFPQKVSVHVTRTGEAAGTEWQILDDEMFPLVSGRDFFDADSVSFGVEENRRFFLEVSVPGNFAYDNILYQLYINTEPILLIRSDLTPGDHFFPFFSGVKQKTAKITGGTAADISDFPWQVYYESGNYTCGGTIIAGDWILTAAHCTEDDYGNFIPASAMDVIVGANNPRSGTEGKIYYVSRVIRHEQYDPVTLNNDIALLQLKSTINYPNATPIRLVSKIDSAAGATDPGVMAWLTGYGLTKVYPPTYPVSLQKVQIPIVSNAQASTVWPDINPTDMMAGYLNGNKDACSGDSGGPLVVPVGDEFKLAGLVSWGSSTCDTYGAYTRVSLFEDWVSSKTGIEISYVPPVPSGDSIVCEGTTGSSYSIGTIDGATSYEWQLLPAEAGTISGNSGLANVTWTSGYLGAATVKTRVTRYGFPSYWSSLTVHVARYNNLLSRSNDTIICAGRPIALDVSCEGYNLGYTWYRDGNKLTSGSSSMLPLANTTVATSGLYRCEISGSCGDPLFAEVNLTVLHVTVINSITRDTKAYFGDNITLDVNADGHNLLYQWRKDGSQLPDGTSSYYVMNDVNASNTGLYSVNVTGTCGEVLSSNIYVYVTDNKTATNREILVWPTVTSDLLNVAMSTEDEYRITLFNTAGTLLIDKPGCQYKTTISIAHLPMGIYILDVYSNGFRKSVKLIRN